MNSRRSPYSTGVVMLLVGVLASSASAITPGLSTDFTGSWTGTNWSLPTTAVYNWNNCSAVAIDPYHMLTARHVGGAVGDSISIGDTVYTVVNAYGPPNGTYESIPPDLWLMTFDKPLPAYEPLFSGTLTQGQATIMIGYGYTGTGGASSYTWNTSTARIKRWGTNSIDVPASEVYYAPGSSLIYGSTAFSMNYTAGGTEFEAGYATFDSGGGTFVKVGDTWELAGINAYVASAGGTTATASYAVSVPYYYWWITQNLRPLLGDTNNDGVVGLADLNNVLNEFGKKGTGLLGDTDGDGVVGLSDLNNVLDEFGMHVPGYMGASVSASPEPATLLLMTAGAAALLRRRRRA